MKWYNRILKNPKISISSLAVLCVCFYAYTVVTAPPTIEATNLRPTNPPVATSIFPFEGTISPASELTINGKTISVKNNGRFSYNVPLNEGDNTISMTIKKNGKTLTRSFSVYRLSAKEVAQKNSSDVVAAGSLPSVSEVPVLEPVLPQTSAPAPQAAFNDGTFVIGRDIQPGTYKSSTPDACHYENTASNGNVIKNILGGLNGKKEVIVTITPNDLSFVSQGCGVWSPLN